MKIKIILDCNTFDKLINYSSDDINLIIEKCTILNCHTLRMEIDKAKISNPEKHAKIIEIFEILDKENCSLFGFLDWRYDSIDDINNNIGPLHNWNDTNKLKAAIISYNDYDNYKKIHPNATKIKAEQDKQITLVASTHDFDILVTEDVTFRNHYTKLNKTVLSVCEFMIYLKK